MAASFPNSLHQWSRQCTPVARKLVRSIIATSPQPLSTKDIFNIAVNKTGISPSSDKPLQRLVPRKPISQAQSRRGLERQPPPEPPHPKHAIRSISYLKNIVLPHLAASNVVEKVCTKRTLSQAEVEQRLQTMTKSARRQQGDLLSTAVNTWLWQAKVKQKPKPSASGKHQKSLLKPEPPRFTSAAVGHGEDWSHLNKRRQRARKLKVQRDLNWMWKLQNTRRDAALQILNSQSSIPRIGTSTDVA